MSMEDMDVVRMVAVLTGIIVVAVWLLLGEK